MDAGGGRSSLCEGGLCRNSCVYVAFEDAMTKKAFMRSSFEAQDL